MHLLLPQISMLNLAPVKYANCFETEGGPLASIEETTLEFFGRRMAVANARLSDNIRKGLSRNVVFSDADGTGIHENPLTARHIAISEALERWAHSMLWASDSANAYGFDIDPTSNGMSAFPGLFPKQARQFALREAIERFGLIAWWSGNTPAHRVFMDTATHTDTYRIEQPFPHAEVVVTRMQSADGFFCYGYGSGRDINSARRRALIEMERSRMMLSRFFDRNPGFVAGDLSTLPDMLERRLVYFSLPDGAAEFDRRVSETRTGKTIAKPSPRFDGEIIGPWSRYATVWRVALDMPTEAYFDPAQRFFYW